MSIKKYINNAWQEISQLKKYIDSAWQDCEFARKYKDGAWVDVWDNGATCTFHHLNNLSESDYSYSTSDNGEILNVTIKAPSTSTPHSLWFVINNSGGFGKEITVEYTLTQKITDLFADTSILGADGAQINRPNTAYYYYYSCTNATLKTTHTFTTEQPYMYLYFSCWTNHNATYKISNLKINGKAVKFKV